MVKIEILKKRMKKAEKYMNYLKKISSEYDDESFKNDPMVFGSAERFLHLLIEALLDIGNHIISDQDLGEVEFYKDIPIILYENNYLDEAQKDIFIKITGFRNILVHDYMEIDLDIVYAVLQDNLNDLKSILKVYVQFL